ncbi:antibiotic biosynthesis monooxygenase [Herbaspirillum hiltneri N3]|uniref:Antibiotic biosynthesis monooxygenase n=1 Tax=Herbaspirillum hiltneri N3 TaxID=1262470 RepID=A0ABN4HUY7_9BURK|nr:putative quinol monooxygenase [Herbaspirillum hiltneri]AKZ61982.1 antibiotic biosynthesis monooxygenase [Herbaspirillum hiltneri N3]
MTDVATAFVVIAEFEVKSASMADFLALAHDDARHSVADEPGCRQFDVVCIADSTRVLFYEIYDDRAAFDLHLETPHLARFRAGFPACIERELAVRFGSIANGGKA